MPPAAFVDEKPVRPRRLTDRCPFTFRGRPVTKPSTPADAKRIQLSQWITRILVRDGDEPLNAYLTPGAAGYTPQEMADAETHYAHLKEAPAVPDSELQRQALQLLREGIPQSEIKGELGIPYTKLVEWRQDATFLQAWEDARAEGKGQRPRSSPVKDSALAQRAPAPAPIIPSQPMPQKPAQKELQEKVLALLREGKPSGEIMAQVKGFNGMKLAEWRKDYTFSKAWDAAKAEGRKAQGSPAPKPAPPKPVAPAPLPVAPQAVPRTAASAVEAKEPGRFAVADDIPNEQPFAWCSEEEAIAEAQRRAKETKQPTYVLRAVLEILPEITITTTSRTL